MADTKISDLTEITDPVLDDIVVGVDVSEAANRKFTLSRLLGLVGFTPGGRLTLTSGTPVTTADVTGASTLYYTPYLHNLIRIWDGTRYLVLTFTEVSLALSGLTSGKPYDVFGYVNAGALALELLAWTNDTTRATGLTRTDGILHKTGDQTRMFLGTLYTTGTTTTEDSAAKRLLWNAFNQRPRPMRNATETADNWSVNTASAYRQANANAANQLEFIAGDAEVRIEAEVIASVFCASGTTQFGVGIGIDSTTVNSAQHRATRSIGSTGAVVGLTARYKGFPGVGRHTMPWLEISNASTLFFGDDGGGGGLGFIQSGISGELFG